MTAYESGAHAVPRPGTIPSPRPPHVLPSSGIAVVLLSVWVLAIYGQTTASMVAIWDRSDTFAHGYLIFPLFLYLLWRCRSTLTDLAPVPFLPALGAVAAAGVIWLLATQLRINSVAQFAMVAMIPLVVWAVLGTATVRVLAFPLGYLFFAVPIGEFLIPVLMEWTADITVVAIRASGVPVYREGNFFMIPTGRWSVVEACSGLRYLIASFMVGCLFAYLFFRSAKRRWIFAGVSLLVPLVANWIRAYMIVMLGHLSDNRIAAGADHLLYGWVFFGVVMAILFWTGARWREDEPAAGAAESAPAAGPVTAAPAIWQQRNVQVTIVAALVLTATWPLLQMRGQSGSMIPPARHIAALPGAGGWMATTDALSEWRPDLSGANAELAQTFVKDGVRVGLYVALFDDPTGNSKAITSTNQLVRTTNKQWAQVGSGAQQRAVPNESRSIRTAIVTGNRQRLAVWQWYWVGGRTTASDFTARLYEGFGLLQGRREPVAWVVLATASEPGSDSAGLALESFAGAMDEAIAASLRLATGGDDDAKR